MLDRQLTVHFHLDSKVDQIRWSSTTGIWVEPNKFQIWLHTLLAIKCEQLFRVPLGIPVRVVSGQRNEAIVAALKEAGYPVALRTDHYFMALVDGWMLTLGAWDIDFPTHKQDAEAFFRQAYEYLRTHPVAQAFVGQLIYYPAKEIIHIANSPECIFEGRTASIVRKLKAQADGYYQCLYQTPEGTFDIFGGQEIRRAA